MQKKNVEEENFFSFLLGEQLINHFSVVAAVFSCNQTLRVKLRFEDPADVALGSSDIKCHFKVW